jgi:large subunit ribosomal protein L2
MVRVYYKVNKIRLVPKQLVVLSKKDSRTPSKRHFRSLRRYHSLRFNNYLKNKVYFYKKRLGRTSNGQLVSFYREAGYKKKYREIENVRNPLINQGIVESFEYNPTHSILLARIYNPLLNYHFYIRSPLDFAVGSYIYTESKKFLIGDCNIIRNIPSGFSVHNINLNNTNNIARSSGVFASIIQKYRNVTLVRFPSKQMLYLSSLSQATCGKLFNTQHRLINLGKAGRSRWLGLRPHVRGVAMNPIDHPHGGGQGKTSGGHSTSVSPWGKPTKQIKKKKKLNEAKNKNQIKISQKIY